MIVMNDFKTEYKFFKKSINRTVSLVLESGRYVLGKKVEEFEKDFAKYVGSKYCVGVGNGMEALQISLIAAGIGSGDEVITVSNSAVATSLAISSVGAKPVFVDIDEYFHMDSGKIEEKITINTKAIIPVHLFGQMADMSSILKIARKHNLKVIEDACQAHGASLNGKKAGSLGDMGCFSFYPTKNLGGYGDGGAIITDSKTLYEKCIRLRNYGQSERYEHKEKGLNSRLDEVQAAILLEKLKKLDQLNKKRQKNARIYFEKLKGVLGLELPKKRNGANHIYHLLVIRAYYRDNLQKYLEEKNIQTLIHYPIPIHKQECYLEYNGITLEETEKASREILSLPINPFLKEEEIKYICSEIKQFYKTKLSSVTVAVSAYNEEANIQNFLNSVLSQKVEGYKFNEILVVSDGSNDNTVKLVNKIIEKQKISNNQNLPKLTLINDGKRIGKAQRLNEIFETVKSDILVLTDADVLFADQFVITNFVRSFNQDPNVGLVGGNPEPQVAQTFVGKIIRVYEIFWSKVIQGINKGINVHTNMGCICAMRREFIKKTEIPFNITAEDHYLFFQAIKLGYLYKYSSASRIIYKVPLTFKDYMYQSTRYFQSAQKIREYFGEWVNDYYKIPSNAKFFAYIKTFFEEPIFLPLSLLLMGIQRLTSFMFKQNSTDGIWVSVRSSK